MKTLKNYFLYSLLLFVFMVPACQQDDLESMRVQPREIGKITTPGFKSIPTPEIIKEEFDEATGWRITWDDSQINNGNWKEHPGVFSTLHGTLHSINGLNNAAPQVTKDTDMLLPFGNIAAPGRSPSLDYQHLAKSTQFKRSDMSAADLEAITEFNPDFFQYLFENESYQVDEVQPINEETGSYYYEAGDIFTFKTDRFPARFGAVRIVKKNNPTIVEVVVQKGGGGGFTM